MSVDRFIKWGKSSTSGRPTVDRLVAVAKDFLGKSWEVTVVEGRGANASTIVCQTTEPNTWPLASEYVPGQEHDGPPTKKESDRMRSEIAKMNRGFEIFFLGKHGQKQTSVITRHSDEFTDAVADQYAKLIARWWDGVIEWPS